MYIYIYNYLYTIASWEHVLETWIFGPLRVGKSINFRAIVQSRSPPMPSAVGNQELSWQPRKPNHRGTEQDKTCWAEDDPLISLRIKMEA